MEHKGLQREGKDSPSVRPHTSGIRAPRPGRRPKNLLVTLLPPCHIGFEHLVSLSDCEGPQVWASESPSSLINTLPGLSHKAWHEGCALGRPRRGPELQRIMQDLLFSKTDSLILSPLERMLIQTSPFPAKHSVLGKLGWLCIMKSFI